MTEDIRIVEAITVKPGDRVLLTIDHLDPEGAQRMSDALSVNFPDVVFVLVEATSAAKFEPGPDLPGVITEVTRRARIQPHDTPATEMLDDVAKGLRAYWTEGPGSKHPVTFPEDD